MSDETGGKKPRKTLVRLTPSQWVAARHQYESEPCSDARSVEHIMAQNDVSERTVRLRIAAQNWRKGVVIADAAADKLHQIVDAKLEPIGEEIVQRLAKKVEADMAPWFEREKRKHSKDALRRIRKRQRLVDDLVENTDALTPKDAAYIAKSDDTYDNMARRNLGMNDSTGLGGSLSINVLTNQAAVQINQK